jgi:hypothetical protein
MKSTAVMATNKNRSRSLRVVVGATSPGTFAEQRFALSVLGFVLEESTSRRAGTGLELMVLRELYIRLSGPSLEEPS